MPAEGITPRQEFNRDSRQLKFLDAASVGRAFLHYETRIIDSGACFSYAGRKYAVPAALIGAKVDISYDPMDTDTIRVEYPGTEPYEAKPVVIGEYVSDEQVKLPGYMQTEEPEVSRFLQGLQKKHESRSRQAADAISFGDYKKEVADDV